MKVMLNYSAMKLAIFCLPVLFSSSAAFADYSPTVSDSPHSFENASSAYSNQQLIGGVKNTAIKEGTEQNENELPWTFKNGKACSEFINAWMEENHPEYLRANLNLSPASVVLVDRSADTLNDTLKVFGIPHTYIPVEKTYKCHPYPIRKHWKNISWEQAKVIILPCGGLHPSAKNNYISGEISDDIAAKFRTFVESGGLLITSGYSSADVASIFPDVLSIVKAYKPIHHNRWGFLVCGNNYFFQNWQVSATDTDNELLCGIPKQMWDTSSKRNFFCWWPLIIQPLNTAKTKVLAVSTTLAEQDPNHQGIVAMQYDYGAGHILIFTCHLGDDGENSFFRSLMTHSINLSQAIMINAIAKAISPHSQRFSKTRTLTTDCLR